jgi:hypothetical protein
MKKLLLAAVLFISLATSAQTFTRHYDLVVTKSNISNRITEVEPTNVTAIFSGNDKGDIIILNSTATDLIAERYYKTGRIYEGTSKDGFKYRYIETRNEKQEKVIMQLFDMGVFRVHTSQATYEYQQANN